MLFKKDGFKISVIGICIFVFIASILFFTNNTHDKFVAEDFFLSNSNYALQTISNTKSYVVNYDGNGGLYEGDEIYRDMARPVYGEEYRVYSNDDFFVREGYTFTDWKDQDGNTWDAGIIIWQYDKDITLYAQWEPKTYVINYDGNGGLYEGEETYRDIAIPVYGEEYRVYTNDDFFVREGYTFTGWKDQDGNTWDAGIIIWQYDKDITLYAQWEKNNNAPVVPVETYTVFYNANGGTNAPGSQTKTHNVDLILSNQIPTNEGHIFKGWSTKSSSTTAQYQVGGTFAINENTTLYAVWEINRYIIEYELNGGVITDQPSSAGYNEIVTIKNPTKDIIVYCNSNKTDATIGDNPVAKLGFKGWTSSDVDTNNAYYGDKKWTDKLTFVTETKFKNLSIVNNGKVTLVANWEDASVKLPSITKDGYTCNWNTNANGKGDSYEVGDEYIISSNSSSANLYAICEALTEEDEELDKTPTTGDTLIVVVWIVGLGALGYSVYYFMKRKNNI